MDKLKQGGYILFITVLLTIYLWGNPSQHVGLSASVTYGNTLDNS